jgi:hypothetical protein
VRDGARHRGQGEGVDQHLVAGLDARGLEGDEERAAAGVEPDRVADAEGAGELLLEERRLRQPGPVLAVAEQTAVAHQAERRIDSFVWNRVRRAQVLGEDRTLGCVVRCCEFRHRALPPARANLPHDPACSTVSKRPFLFFCKRPNLSRRAGPA